MQNSMCGCNFDHECWCGECQQYKTPLFVSLTRKSSGEPEAKRSSEAERYPELTISESPASMGSQSFGAGDPDRALTLVLDCHMCIPS